MSARGARGAAPPPVSAEAERLVQEAAHLAGSWELAKVADAAERYRAAIALEPRFAAAWAGLTHTDIVLSFLGPNPADALADSEADARRALELDGTLAAGHAALGHSYWHQWRWREAGEALRRAVDLDDGDAVARQLYGLYLACAGRPAEAIRHSRRAVELAPVSGLVNYSLAQVYLQTGDFEAAITQAERTLEIDRHFPLAFSTLVRANIQLGRPAAASQAVDAALRFGPESDIDVWQAYLMAMTGRAEDARRILDSRRMARPRPRGSVGEAAVLVALGDPEAALAALGEAVDAHVRSVLWLGTAPELAPLRQDPRFGTLLARLHAR